MNSKLYNLINVKLLFRIVFLCIYIYLYKYIWITFNVEHFDYLGYSYNVIYDENNYVSYIIALLPVLFYSNKKKISVFFSTIIYLLSYIPIILSVRFMENESWENMIFPIQISLMFFMILFFISDRINLGFRRIEFRRIISPNFVLVCTCLITCFLFFVFRDVMRLVSLDQVYDLRSEADVVQNSGLNGYFLMWGTRVFYPLVLLYGLSRNKLYYIILGFSLFLFSFTLTALKSNLFLPFILTTMFYTYKYYSKDILLFIVLGLILSSLFFISLSNEYFLYKAIFFMRTLSVSGLIFGIYMDFFIVNDFTNYSHISFVNKLTHSYKYDQDLGKVIGDAYGANINAGFWTTDGYAANGVLGLWIISIIFLCFLLLMNSITAKINYRYCILVLLPSLLSLLNASFFTFLLSCGIFLIIIYFLLGREFKNLK